MVGSFSVFIFSYRSNRSTTTPLIPFRLNCILTPRIDGFSVGIWIGKWQSAVVKNTSPNSKTLCFFNNDVIMITFLLNFLNYFLYLGLVQKWSSHVKGTPVITICTSGGRESRRSKGVNHLWTFPKCIDTTNILPLGDRRWSAPTFENFSSCLCWKLGKVLRFRRLHKSAFKTFIIDPRFVQISGICILVFGRLLFIFDRKKCPETIYQQFLVGSRLGMLTFK